MFYSMRIGGGFPRKGLALALGIWVFAGSSAMAQGNVGAGASGGVTGAAGGGAASAGIGGGLMGGGMGGIGNAGPAGTSGVGVGNTGGLGETSGMGGFSGSAYGGAGSGASGMVPGVAGAPYGGVAYGGYGVGNGDFGLGYPYTRGHGMGCRYPYGYAIRQLSLRNWCSDLLGRECLDPYWADPYGLPSSGFGVSSAYAAPTLNTANPATRSR